MQIESRFVQHLNLQRAKCSKRIADSVCSLCGVHKTKVQGFKIHAFTPINPRTPKELENKIK
jgi:hypothetical protein